MDDHEYCLAVSDLDRHLLCACGTGRLDAALSLLDMGANINARDDGGWTPLHWAASHDAAEIIRSLIDRGSNVNCVDKNGITPLYLAASKANPSSVRALLESGANVHGDDGVSPIYIVNSCLEKYSGGHLLKTRFAEVAFCLAEFGADVAKIKDAELRKKLLPFYERFALRADAMISLPDKPGVGL